MPPGPAVALIDGLDVLPFRVRTHASCLHRPGTVTSPMARRFPLGNILDGAIRGQVAARFHRLGAQVIGVDANEELLTAARARSHP